MEPTAGIFFHQTGLFLVKSMNFLATISDVAVCAVKISGHFPTSSPKHDDMW